MALTAGKRIRAQTKEATRRALLQAGLEETIERGGIGTANIEAICARAGYTRGAFYVHFEDRTEFVVAMMDWVLTDILGAVFGSTDQGHADIRVIVERFASILSQSDWPDLTNVRAGYLGVMEAVQRSAVVRERHAGVMNDVIARVAEAVRQGQRDGIVRQDVTARELADLGLLTAVGAVMWDRIGIPLDVPAAAKAFVTLISAGTAKKTSRPARSARKKARSAGSGRRTGPGTSRS